MMPDQLNSEFNVGLSAEEERELDDMISEFQNERSATAAGNDVVELKKQIETMNHRFSQLTEMMLSFDQRIKPLYESLRLTHQKSEILNHRIDALIKSIGSGEPR